MRFQRIEAEKASLTAQIARLESLGGAASRRITKVGEDYKAFVESLKKTIAIEDPPGPDIETN